MSNSIREKPVDRSKARNLLLEYNKHTLRHEILKEAIHSINTCGWLTPEQRFDAIDSVLRKVRIDAQNYYNSILNSDSRNGGGVKKDV